jgi:anti-sigma factor RsiW
MTSPSFRDIEQLSAYLDGQLSQSMRTRLEIRIQSDPAFAAALEELRQTCALLRRTPQRRAPHNFTLTPRMVGIRPPVPRLVPVLSWASAVAMLLFIFTLGTSLVGHLSVGTAAPIGAAAPSTFGGGGPAVAATAAPATMAPVLAVPATQPPVTNETLLATPTLETFGMSVSEATPPSADHVVQSPLASKALHRPLTLWLFIWPGLAVILGLLAILVLWLNKRAFQRKNPRG